MLELFAVPGVTPDLPIRASMVGLIQRHGQIDDAIVMAEGCVAEIGPADPNRGKMCYDLASCLILGNRLDEALDAALEIDGGDDYSKNIRGEMLYMIQLKCDDDKWLPVKECAVRACLGLTPEDGNLQLLLGSTLCKMQKFDEGIPVLERALESGADASKVQPVLDNARAGTYVEPSRSGRRNVVYHARIGRDLQPLTDDVQFM